MIGEPLEVEEKPVQIEVQKNLNNVSKMRY